MKIILTEDEMVKAIDDYLAKTRPDLIGKEVVCSFNCQRNWGKESDVLHRSGSNAMTNLTARRTALLAYAQSCLEAGDYHGCRDACTDLEVIEARLEERAGRKPNRCPGCGEQEGGPHKTTCPMLMLDRADQLMRDRE